MVDFVLVGTLVILIFVALLQLALVLHVRNILIDSAAEGARPARWRVPATQQPSSARGTWSTSPSHRATPVT